MKMKETDVKFCRNCLVNNYTEDVSFNVDGLCCFCESYEKQKKVLTDYEKLESDFEFRIRKIMFDAKNNGSAYDFICPLSGGKDSTYIVYKMKEKFPEARILTITIDNGIQNNEVMNQAKEVAGKLELPNQSIVYDKEFYKTLHGISEKPCGVCTLIIWCEILRVALNYRIPAVIFGDSRDQMMTSYGLNLTQSKDLYGNFEEVSRSDGYWRLFLGRVLNNVIKSILENPNGAKFLKMVHPEIGSPDIAFSYIEKLKEVDIVPFFYFHSHNEIEMKKELQNKLQWRCNDLNGYASHPDCKFHTHFPNISREIEQTSVYIREGVISRRDAADDVIKKISHYLSVNAQDGISDVFAHLDIDVSEMQEKSWYKNKCDTHSIDIYRAIKSELEKI